MTLSVLSPSLKLYNMGDLQVASEAITRLEKLIDRMLAERAELQGRNEKVVAERDGLLKDRAKVRAELDKLLDKLALLERKSA